MKLLILIPLFLSFMNCAIVPNQNENNYLINIDEYYRNVISFDKNHIVISTKSLDWTYVDEYLWDSTFFINIDQEKKYNQDTLVLKTPRFYNFCSKLNDSLFVFSFYDNTNLQSLNHHDIYKEKFVMKEYLYIINNKLKILSIDSVRHVFDVSKFKRFKKILKDKKYYQEPYSYELGSIESTIPIFANNYIEIKNKYQTILRFLNPIIVNKEIINTSVYNKIIDTFDYWIISLENHVLYSPYSSIYPDILRKTYHDTDVNSRLEINTFFWADSVVFIDTLKGGVNVSFCFNEFNGILSVFNKKLEQYFYHQYIPDSVTVINSRLELKLINTKTQSIKKHFFSENQVLSCGFYDKIQNTLLVNIINIPLDDIRLAIRKHDSLNSDNRKPITRPAHFHGSCGKYIAYKFIDNNIQAHNDSFYYSENDLLSVQRIPISNSAYFTSFSDNTLIILGDTINDFKMNKNNIILIKKYNESIKKIKIKKL